MRLAILVCVLAAGASAQELRQIKRVCVEQLNGGVTAAHIRDMIIAALQKSNAFVVTENPERADAILRGSAEDLVFTENFSSQEGVTARASLGGDVARAVTGSSKSTPYASIGAQESERSTERKHEAFATVRLVNKDGDVIWSTTQESLGAKFRGASADVADKIAKQLLTDIDKAKQPSTEPRP